VIPLLTTIIVGILMIVVLGKPIGKLIDSLNSGLTNMSGSNAILLGMVLGLMMAFDMGGPLNKVAYSFAAAGVGAAASAAADDPRLEIMAAVMLAGMVPPIALALATVGVSLTEATLPLSATPSLSCTWAATTSPVRPRAAISGGTPKLSITTPSAWEAFHTIRPMPATSATSSRPMPNSNVSFRTPLAWRTHSDQCRKSSSWESSCACRAISLRWSRRKASASARLAPAKASEIAAGSTRAPLASGPFSASVVPCDTPAPTP